MTSEELTKRGVEAYVGGSFQRAACLLLMALCADRETAAVEVFDAIMPSDLASKGA